MNKAIHAYLSVIPICIISILSFIGIVLSSTVSAGTEVVDTIALTVPIACTMSGTGTTHTATLSPGTYSGTSGSEYENGIGKTTLTAICNDDNGFAIYAVGYTGNQSGVTNLVGEETSGTIATKAYASGDTTSNWSMKLTKVDNPVSGDPVTYNPQNLTLTTGYNTWHAVPDTLTKVAEYKANTGSSTTDTTLGVKLETTYAAFIASNQPADTYIGQVKYIMVHPYYVDKSALEDAITVVFDGNGLTFPNGSTTNTVKYANVCEPGEYAYVGNTYQEVMTSNITTGGTQNGGYTDHESILQSITLPGADKVKVVVDYATTGDTAYATIAEGTWAGWEDSDPEGNYLDIYSDDNLQGQQSHIFNGNTITIDIGSWAAPESGYNKGFYIKVYPVYATEQANTTYEQLPSSDCSIMPISGTYTETTPWKGKWVKNQYDITNERELSNYLIQNYNFVKGTTVTFQAYNPYTLKYNGNGASNELGMGTQQYYQGGDYGGWRIRTLAVGDEVVLLAPNYKRSGYGFIGWSLDSNAASHLSSATLYGPNETITVDQAMLSTTNTNKEVTLYAIWLPSSGNLQNWSGCSSMSTGAVTALTDIRDNDTYAVAKLADGNCWMIENLRLGGSSPITLTTTNTQSAGTLPAATYGEEWDNSPNNVQQIATINTASPETLVENINQRNYAYGNHYSWYAAANRTTLITQSVDITTSICPAGWRLPNKENYQYFIQNSIIPRSFPNNFVVSGFVSYFTHGRFDNYDNRITTSRIPMYGHATGYYWTSLALVTNQVYYYNGYSFGTSNYIYGNTHTGINPYDAGTDGGAAEGYAVRCILSN